MKKKIQNSNYLYLYRIFLVLLSTLAINLYWDNEVIISILLIMFSVLINYKAQKFEIFYFLIIAIFATLVESFAMSSGAWTYENQSILNFPLWLPLYWGMGGIVLKDIYQIFKNVI